jgi:hypothetical protein
MKEAYKWLCLVFAIIAVAIIGAAFFIPVTSYETGAWMLAGLIWSVALALMAFGAWKFQASLKAKLSWFKHGKNLLAAILCTLGIFMMLGAVWFPAVYAYVRSVPMQAYALDVTHDVIEGKYPVVKDVNLISWTYYEGVSIYYKYVQAPLFIAGLFVLLIGLWIGWWSIYTGNIKYEKELAK